jgi:DNA primase
VISKQTIDEVINVAQVDEVIADFMTLKKKGVNLEGLCPFHNEKTPSFKVNPNKGIYKCFGCGKAGGSVQFVMEHEGMSFPDAIKYLAKRYSIDIVEDNTAQSVEYDEKIRLRESLLAVLDFAQTHFTYNLHEDEEGKLAGLEYLKERGFTKQTIEKFGLGYAKSGFENLYHAATKIGYKEEYLELAGLIKKSEGRDSYFDFFRERVIFPFYNVSGKIVAFGGRILKKDIKAPKYLNSPETEVYHKSKILYGIFQSKNEIKKQDNCYLVEGYTDVISLHQSGIENVVASSGTSLTTDQARLIARFSPNVTLLYDGDAAGVKASIRGIDILLEQGLNVRVVLMPEGEDPDSFAKKNDAEFLQNYLKEQAKDFILFKSDLLYIEAGNDPVKKAEANAEVIKSISCIPDPLKRAQYVKEFALVAGLTDEIIQAEVLKVRNKEIAQNYRLLNDEIAMIQQQSVGKKINKTHFIPEQEKAIAACLINYGNMNYEEEQTVSLFILENLLDDNIQFHDSVAKIIVNWFKKRTEEGESPETEDLMRVSTPEISSFIANCSIEEHQLSPAFEKNEIEISTEKDNYKMHVFHCVLNMKMRYLESLLLVKSEEIKTASGEEEKTDILLDFKNLLNLRKLINELIGKPVVV